MHSDKPHLPLLRSPLIEDPPTASQELFRAVDEWEHSKDGVHIETANAGSSLGLPVFYRHSETTNSELFYDLFFVANLTVFLDIHEVNDPVTLKQVVGFFAVLWLTWYQVALYDVRFSMDSVFERVARIFQFIVMIGFSIVGPMFNAGQKQSVSTRDFRQENELPLGYFKALSMFLMVSRLVLVCQYLQAMWHMRKYNKILLPTCCIAATYSISAMIYLGLFWTFKFDDKGENDTYLTWYVVAVAETVIAISISCVWRNISFKGTHLVQRMSLLTLIILGEGVIILAKRAQKFVQSEGGLSIGVPTTIANIICTILILYFIYMLYFDWMEERRKLGTIRQQIWSILHFPLHLALVLSMEGMSQCIAWRASIQKWDVFETTASNWDQLLKQTDQLESLSTSIFNATQSILYSALLTSKGIDETLQYFQDYTNSYNARDAIANGLQNLEAAENALFWMYEINLRTIFNVGGFAPPVNETQLVLYLNTTLDFTDEHFSDDVLGDLGYIETVFKLTYIYFFISIGLVIVICCVMVTMSSANDSRHHRTRVILMIVTGLGLSLIATLAVNVEVLKRFAFSPWLLPLVTLCLFIVAILNNFEPVDPLRGIGALTRA